MSGMLSCIASLVVVKLRCIDCYGSCPLVGWLELAYYIGLVWFVGKKCVLGDKVIARECRFVHRC